MKTYGDEMHELGKRLFPICRSLTGNGVRETFDILKEHLPDLVVHSVPSGYQAFDWQVPQEWNIKDAYVLNEAGERVIDFKKSNLHVVGYSEPVNEKMTLETLCERIHTLPEQPNAIPYITSYYSKYWGFCMAEKAKKALVPGEYHAVIESAHFDGELNYGEIIIPGESEKEVLISTYICHPSMANNELSGPLVTTYLVKWLKGLKNRKYTYRIVFVPETIGSIVYISKNLEHLKKHVVAGFNISCVGDDRAYSFLPSRAGNTISDKAAQYVLKNIDPDFKTYKWLDRGSDERQYCSPGVDLPIASIMRTKYGEYPEYHTSLDDFTLVTPDGLQGGYDAIKQSIEVIERDCRPKITVLCEPQLGKRGLYPNLSTKESGMKVRMMLNLLSYCDGEHTLLDIAQLIDESFDDLYATLQPMIEADLIVLQ
ncbi:MULTISPECIES: DUF4910 domain-containing protein [Vibrio]|uniref:DUF4910 domain-containing protein n=1 Tax=Vibrio TaxID=662 RepID=UPI0001B94ECA|nr:MULTISPECIES: DUF4910 domain-containing protein [Vibrio]AIS56149.2 aminopeptidase [Vibrio coralliilyticus]EEX30740.1 hypothetical protein VIC_005036 [Vibrio coralliilyticus ATCC BAA-450]MCM5509479.1 DUF4910 domain-containing protein [Vibrio sp. SCSIO 43169]MDE3899606.1 DUF4910 domain-containing protein [Vibrio sp. CC007]QFT34981.1 hypothetical protein FIU99_00825 [Vibrio sp. THAF64]